ncbi:MAG: (d)CMP kinase [Alphaproteobacteria bacterium]|nr:(d)CMP kinase [Alphaproteobacteria bacterium]
MSQEKIPFVRQPFVVAIDGPAASGKGTLARRLARYFDLRYLDTGSLYRAVAAKAIQLGVSFDHVQHITQAAKLITESDLRSHLLRSEEVGQMASKVAAIPEVRAALLAYQREFAYTGAGAILDGRDIGTVVCPNSDIKLFVTASLEARAMRRYKELHQNDNSAIYERVLQDLRERDVRDQGRAVAPLAKAQGAVVIDTTDLDADAVFERIVALIHSSLQGNIS